MSRQSCARCFSASVPLAVAGLVGSGSTALRSVVLYMIVYAATNLGIFAVILAVSNKTRSGDVSSFGGLFSYAPALGVLMTLFLASLAGIPPLGGWIAKFVAFQSLIQSQSAWGAVVSLTVMVAVMPSKKRAGHQDHDAAENVPCRLEARHLVLTEMADLVDE